MTIRREHLLIVLAVLVGFVLGAWYQKTNSASLVLAGLSAPTSQNGKNGTATIPIYGMVTAAQGVDQ